MEKIKPYIKGAIVLALFFSSQFLQLGLIYLFKLDINNLKASEATFLTFLTDLILAMILLWMYWKDLKSYAKSFKQNIMKNLDTGFKYWLIGLGIMMASNLIINLFFTKQTSNNEQAVQGLITALPILALFSVGILGPFVEEICFRKVWKDTIKNKWIFVISSGAIFGLLHVIFSFNSILDFLYVIPYGALGSCFAYMYYETDNLLTPMCMHAFHNTALTLMSILL